MPAEGSLDMPGHTGPPRVDSVRYRDDPARMSALTKGEVMKVVNRYVGVSGGFLGDFSYRTHEEFYPEFCDLDIDPNKHQGTTRERFIAVLVSARPRDQAKILRGVLKRFPVGGQPAPDTRTEEQRNSLLQLIARLEGASPVESHTPQDASEIVERAISDAETLLRTSGASSGVDRVHTALHGYLQDVCRAASIDCPDDASLAVLLKAIRNGHPAFKNDAIRRQDISTVLQSMGSVAHALDPLRNNASPAHPNPLLEEPEAMLVMNAARTVLHYIDARRRLYERSAFGGTTSSS